MKALQLNKLSGPGRVSPGGRGAKCWPLLDSQEASLYQASTACDTAAASQEANKYEG